ncbi:MAG: translation initiation factor IF-2 N-terminal domain-containing protein [Pirellulales bacterium]
MPEEVLVEEPVAEVVEPEVVEPEVEEPEVKPSTPEVTREAYVRPRGSMGGKVRVIGSRARATEAKPADEKRKAKTREPVINIGFAKIPKSGMQAPPAPKKDEPAPQKPEIKLTRDLIVGSRQGDKTQLDQFVQAENQKSKAALAAAAPGGLSKFKADADKAKAKGKKGDEIDEEEEVKGKRGLSGLAASRADRSTKRRVKLRPDDINTEEDEVGRGSKQFKQRRGGSTAAPRKEKVALELPCTVRSFSEAAGVPAARVLRSLMGMGLQTLNINAALDEEQAMILATELGVDLEFKSPETLENSLLRTIDNLEDSEEDLAVRPPIVTFLGHVDHGKTSLLDYLIGTKIVLGEAGGITQHIRAYQVEKDGRFVSFVDTPGHEAFTEMRARGANVTDIAVLVIAADDGIMPQTEEAISHAKAANVPIVVALNKIDLPGADANRVMTQMTEHGLTPSEWGGDVEVVRTSAITGQGMDELLDTLLTVAELHEFRANPNRAAVGVCLESEQESIAV